MKCFSFAYSWACIHMQDYENQLCALLNKFNKIIMQKNNSEDLTLKCNRMQFMKLKTSGWINFYSKAFLVPKFICSRLRLHLWKCDINTQGRYLNIWECLHRTLDIDLLQRSRKFSTRSRVLKRSQNTQLGNERDEAKQCKLVACMKGKL